MGEYDDDKDAEIETNVGFEDLRPELDLNLPFVDMDALIEDEKATQAVIDQDIEEFRVKHGMITKVTYIKGLPPDVASNGNACSDAERQRLIRGTDNTLKVV